MLFAGIASFMFTRAVAYARGVMAILLGFAFSHQYAVLVPNNNFLNIVAWVAICLCAIYILSMLPRLDFSIRFFCTCFIALIGSTIIISTFGGIIAPNFQVTATMEIFIKFICVAISVLSIYLQGKKLLADFGSNIFIRIIDRFLASFLYGVCGSFLVSPVFGQWSISSTISNTVIIVVTIVMFVLDLFFAKKLLFGYTPPEKIEMPK